jgi:hypothetical protein
LKELLRRSEVQWEFVGTRFDGDKGGGMNTAGSTKGLTVVKLLGDWDILVWGLEGGGCCIGKNATFKAAHHRSSPSPLQHVKRFRKLPVLSKS